MEELMNKYNNKIFKIFFDSKEYTAIFRIVEDVLAFEIENSVQLCNLFNKKKISLLNGKFEEKNIVIINSWICKYNSKYITFKIDRLLIGFLLGKNVNNKKIKKFRCSFYGLNEFDLNKYYTQKPLDTFKINFSSETFPIDIGKLNFIKTNQIISGVEKVVIKKVNEFIFEYNNKVNISKAVFDIWHLKNMFSILSKKEIGVEKIELYYDENTYGTLFMNYVKKPDYTCKNEFLEHEKKDFVITYDNIKKDFNNIYRNSYICFEKINPIIQMYLDSLEKEMPRLNKFLAFNQMLECFSREYDDKNAYSSMIKIEPQKANKNEAELKYRIYSLIKKVNFIYCFKDSRILSISTKIALGRNYYIHYDSSKKKNELANNKLFEYGYFLEDILLANIYLELGISRDVIKDALKNPFFYRISNIK